MRSAASACSDIREINEAKVANILAYLDDAAGSVSPVKESCCGSIASEVPLTASALQHITRSLPSNGSAKEPRGPPPCGAVSSSVMLAPTESAQATYLGIKKRIEALQFENELLQRDNGELRQRLESWKAREGAIRTDAAASVRAEVDDLRKELALTKKRGNDRLEKLTAEKEQLARSTEALSAQLRQEMARREEDRAKLEAANTAAIVALKSKWQAQEKATRDKWKQAETKRIKETTLQSLEPDIVLLLNRHKAEKARLREEFENELRQRDEVISAKDASVEELKSKLQRESEAVLSREQAAFQSRLHEEVDRVHRLLEEERRAEKTKREQMEYFFEEQKRTLQQEVARLGREVLQLKAAQTAEQAAFHESVGKEVARVTGESNEMLSQLKEKLMTEFACREKEAMIQNSQYLHAKEEELRKKCELERDTAITKVVHRLEEEHLRALSSARTSDGVLRERYGQLSRDNEHLRVELELVREQLREALVARQKREEEVASMREATELSEKRVKAIEDRIHSEYETKLNILDNEWHKKLNEMESVRVTEACAAQQDRENLLRELQIAKSQHEAEMKTVEQRHHVELSQINERVLVALTKKDSTIQSQQEQLLALQEAIQVRDAELQRHRSLLE